MSSARLVEHFFRHEYGRVCAMLSCRFGFGRIDAVEDAVQSALVAALDAWSRGPLPDNPSAWVYRAAFNFFIGAERTHKRQSKLAHQDAQAAITVVGALPDVNADDELLHMLFVACDESIPIESQLIFSLKTLCGFDIREIAERLFLTEANVYKRYSRAKTQLKKISSSYKPLSEAQYNNRRAAVQAVVYLLFTEGYLSSHESLAIREELCAEALRLGALLVRHQAGQTPDTFALLALMHLHAARLPGRQNASGALMLLEEQDRSLWNARQIKAGLAWLARSAEGDLFTRFHAEAGVAAAHCVATSFATTNWERIEGLYAMLEHFEPSPLHTLNRALAVAEWKGARSGLALMEAVVPPTWLLGSYMWSAVLADLHRRAGDREAAAFHREAALRLAPTGAIRAALRRRLGADA